MNFTVYDVSLLILFVLFSSIFLYSKRKNLKKDGWLYLYKTKWGINLIDKIGKKYQKTLKFLSYISIGIGYILMASMLYLFVKIVYIYIAYPNVVKAVKVPPIMPLIPYLPQAFKLDFLPPFYFIYWIIILAIIAITHEFAHGIFMRRYGIKIKSTGFGFFPFFLPIFLAAFVEQDEKSMNKAGKFKQMAVLSAGTFANILTAILFFLIAVLFFTYAFTPSGIVFDNYAYDVIGIGTISMVNNISLVNPDYDGILSLLDEKEINEIKTKDRKYLLTKEFLEKQKNNQESILVYLDAPAVKSGLKGAILEIDREGVNSVDDLSRILGKHFPGDEIFIKTSEGDYKIILGKYPDNPKKAWLGISFENNAPKGVIGRTLNYLTSFKKPNVYYASKFGAGEFIYNFLWWLILISLSVALVNMLPMGIFDGGRFFYLTIWGLTKSEKKAKKWFGAMTYLLLALVFLIMIFWVISWLK